MTDIPTPFSASADHVGRTFRWAKRKRSDWDSSRSLLRTGLQPETLYATLGPPLQIIPLDISHDQASDISRETKRKNKRMNIRMNISIRTRALLTAALLVPALPAVITYLSRWDETFYFLGCNPTAPQALNLLLLGCTAALTLIWIVGRQQASMKIEAHQEVHQHTAGGGIDTLLGYATDETDYVAGAISETADVSTQSGPGAPTDGSRGPVSSREFDHLWPTPEEDPTVVVEGDAGPVTLKDSLAHSIGERNDDWAEATPLPLNGAINDESASAASPATLQGIAAAYVAAESSSDSELVILYGDEAEQPATDDAMGTPITNLSPLAASKEHDIVIIAQRSDPDSAEARLAAIVATHERSVRLTEAERQVGDGPAVTVHRIVPVTDRRDRTAVA